MITKDKAANCTKKAEKRLLKKIAKKIHKAAKRGEWEIELDFHDSSDIPDMLMHKYGFNMRKLEIREKSGKKIYGREVYVFGWNTPF